MITARVYKSPISDRITTDMYLGNNTDSPIYIEEIELCIVDYDKASKSLLLSMFGKDKAMLSLIRANRLYVDASMSNEVVRTSKEISFDKEVMKNIRTFRVAKEKD